MSIQNFTGPYRRRGYIGWTFNSIGGLDVINPRASHALRPARLEIAKTTASVRPRQRLISTTGFRPRVLGAAAATTRYFITTNGGGGGRWLRRRPECRDRGHDCLINGHEYLTKHRWILMDTPPSDVRDFVFSNDDEAACVSPCRLAQHAR